MKDITTKYLVQDIQLNYMRLLSEPLILYNDLEFVTNSFLLLQIRASHVDAHYCAALFRYLREFGIMHKEIANFISMDDKHKVKCGEPGYPVSLAVVSLHVTQGFNNLLQYFTSLPSQLNMIPFISV